MATDFDNRSGVMEIECDTCGEIITLDGDFKHCIAEAKTAGWIVIKKRGGFHHYCSENCKGEG